MIASSSLQKQKLWEIMQTIGVFFCIVLKLFIYSSELRFAGHMMMKQTTTTSKLAIKTTLLRFINASFLLFS